MRQRDEDRAELFWRELDKVKPMPRDAIGGIYVRTDRRRRRGHVTPAWLYWWLCGAIGVVTGVLVYGLLLLR